MFGPGMYGGGAVPGVYGYPPGGAQQAPQASSSRPAREQQPSTYTEGKVFIGGIDPKITSEDVVAHCSSWGEVVDAVAIKDRGYGFATFKDPAAAQSFLETKQHVIKGVTLDVKAAMPKAMGGSARRTRKMFVGGTGELTDEDLREHFSQFGVIEDAAVIRREQKSRGFGFVTFGDETCVEKCLVQHHVIKGRKVELKRAVPKDHMPQPGGDVMAGGMPPAMGPVPGTAGPYGPQQHAGGFGPFMGMRPTALGMDPYTMMMYPAMWGYHPAAYQYPPPMQPVPHGMAWQDPAAAGQQAAMAARGMSPAPMRQGGGMGYPAAAAAAAAGGHPGRAAHAPARGGGGGGGGAGPGVMRSASAASSSSGGGAAGVAGLASQLGAVGLGPGASSSGGSGSGGGGARAGTPPGLVGNPQQQRQQQQQQQQQQRLGPAASAAGLVTPGPATPVTAAKQPSAGGGPAAGGQQGSRVDWDVARASTDQGQR